MIVGMPPTIATPSACPADSIGACFRPVARTPDESGSPAWLAVGDYPGARWRRIAPGGDGLTFGRPGPTLLPQLQVETRSPLLYGRPSLVATVPERVEFAAWARDVSGLSPTELGRLMSPAPEPWRVERAAAEAARKQADRDTKAGRARLHDDGVLPWAAFDEGIVEDEWWTSEQFADAIQQWRREAVTDPSPPPPSIADLIARSIVSPEQMRRIAQTAALDLDRPAQLREIERNPWRWPSC